MGEGQHPEEIARGTSVPNTNCLTEEKAEKAIHSRIWGKSCRPAGLNKQIVCLFGTKIKDRKTALASLAS